MVLAYSMKGNSLLCPKCHLQFQLFLMLQDEKMLFDILLVSGAIPWNSPYGFCLEQSYENLSGIITVCCSIIAGKRYD